MEYRFNFLSSIIYSLIPFATNILLWIAIYATNSKSFEMSLKNIITYFFLVFIVENLISNNSLYSIGTEIKNGDISKYIIKPFNYRTYMFFKALAHNLLFIIVGIIPVLIILIFLSNNLSLNISIASVIAFISALVIGYLINYYINFLLSSLAFFVSEVSSLFITFDVLKGLVTGKVIPLSYFPKVLSNFISFTPFPFICYFPVVILTNDCSSEFVLSNLMFGIIWIVILYLLCNLTWKTGIQRYSSYGG